ncbi:MAG TPA: glycosyltransferase family 4 protein [Candidatus Limnocylindria bacterium]|nr:glycosyltransferase family 4 protein [Candidatus Limnocylindria bacterium]
MRVIHITTSDMSLRYLLLDQLRYLQAEGHEVTAVSGPGPWVEAVRAAGIPVKTVPLTRRIAPFQDLGAFGALAWHLLRTRPDVVHTHTPKASLLGQWAAALVRVRRRVHTIHGLYFPGHMRPERRWLYVWLERLQMAPAHVILSQNAEDLETVRRDHIADPRRLRYLGNGIDLARFQPDGASVKSRAATRAAIGVPDGDLVVGMVGRLVREKGYPELFEAARLVLRERPDTTFISIGGEEPAKGDCVELDDPALVALGDRMKMLGHRDDVEDLYAAMDLLVLPSHREGFPRAPMEAAATGIPVVATDVRGCRDVVVDGETGLLVPVRDPERLAAAILRILGDDRLRARMGVAGRALAEERFDQRAVFQRVADAYRESPPAS